MLIKHKKRNRFGQFQNTRKMQIKMWFQETAQRINRFMQIVGWGVVLGVIGGISVFALNLHLAENVYAAHSGLVEEMSSQKQVVEPEPKEVLIEVVYNWTPERIAQEIDKVFHDDAPIMHEVMRCESGGKIDAYNPTNNSHDNGLFQISDLYHGSEVRQRGLDVGNPVDNIAFAKILFDRSGLQPWSASKHCWSR